MALKLKLRDDLTTQQIVDVINDYERELKAALPVVRWCFVEPDVVA